MQLSGTPPAADPDFILFCKDLTVVPQVQHAARQAQRDCVAVISLAGLADRLAALPNTRARTVLVDLGQPVDLPALVAQVRGHATAHRIVGFVAHVRTDLIEAAQAAGFDQVLARGQFLKGLAAVVGNPPAAG